VVGRRAAAADQRRAAGAAEAADVGADELPGLTLHRADRAAETVDDGRPERVPRLRGERVVRHADDERGELLSVGHGPHATAETRAVNVSPGSPRSSPRQPGPIPTLIC
jgi:hypothetical protein